MAAAQWTLALDIGGTKMAAGLVRADGNVVVQDSRPTRGQASAEALFDDLLALSDGVLAAENVQPAELYGVGVGCGGPMLYPEGRVSPLNIPAWRDFPLRASLEQRYGRPALVDNDAKALALGEHWIGAGRGARCLLGMVVSTGRRRRHRRGWPPDSRDARQRRPRRPRDRLPQRAALRVRGAGLCRGRRLRDRAGEAGASSAGARVAARACPMLPWAPTW